MSSLLRKRKRIESNVDNTISSLKNKLNQIVSPRVSVQIPIYFFFLFLFLKETNIFLPIEKDED